MLARAAEVEPMAKVCMERSEGARGSLFFFEPLSKAEKVSKMCVCVCDLTFVSGWIILFDDFFDLLNLLSERRGRA